MTAVAELPPADRLAADLGDRYRVCGLVGRGAFATVWEVLDRATGQPVAVKRFAPRPPGAGAGDGFYPELRALLRLRHPRVVRVLNLHDRPAGRLLVLEFCSGGTLRPTLTGRPWPLARAAEVGQQVFDGLAAVHAAGLTHRDVKPENVLFEAARPGPWGGGAGVKLADFGLAGAGRPLDTLGSVDGSPPYMAPEQFVGPGGPAADVYAVGAVLFELVHGRPLFAGTVGELARQHLNAAPTIDPGLPAGWRHLLLRLLAKRPADRPTAAEAGRLLAAEGDGAGGFSRCLGVPAVAVAARPGPDGPEFAAVAPGGLYRLGGRRTDPVRRTPLPPARAAHAGPDGTVWLGCGAEVWRLPPGADRATFAFAAAGPVDGLAASGDRVAVLANGTVTDHRSDGEPVWAAPADGRLPVARLADGVVVCVTVDRLLVLDGDGRTRRDITLPGPCGGVAPWPGGDLLAVLAGDDLVQVAAVGPAVRWAAPAGGLLRLATPPVGDRVLGLFADGRVVGWDEGGAAADAGRLDLPGWGPVAGFASDASRHAAAAGDWVAVGGGLT